MVLSVAKQRTVKGMNDQTTLPDTTISGRLQAIRTRAGYSQRALADAIGMAQATYATYERSRVYKQPYLPMRLVERLLPVVVGRGDPPIGEAEVYGLAGVRHPGYSQSAIGAIPGASNVRRAAASDLPSIVHRPRDVPIYAALPAPGGFRMSLLSDPVELARRPEALDGVVSAVAFYAVDETMAPWRQPGELVYVHRGRPAALGCHVIVRTEADEDVWKLRKLVGRDGGMLVLQQYNPPLIEEVPAEQVVDILRVMEWQEVAGLI